MLNNEGIRKLHDFYKDHLLNDVMPFWIKHSLDEQYGGYMTWLDRDGSILSTDKPVWMQGRGVWTYSRLCNEFGKREEWVNAARLGYEFLTDHCYDKDGRLFFLVTKEGMPLRKRRYLFSECFAVIACAEYAKLSGDEEALKRARDTYKLILDYYGNPEKLPSKTYSETRNMKSHAMPMILVAVSQVLREAAGSNAYDDIIQSLIEEIFNDFVKRDKKALLENVGTEGEFIDLPQGRCINPGHAIETSWFLMEEGRKCGDSAIIQKALEILDWSLEWGWDKEYGGLLYFVDVDGKPPEQLEWDMKLWWPHTEAIYALLLAYRITGDCKYEKWHKKVHDWTFNHFSDKEFGEWYGYLHRDGTVSSRVKGCIWKGPFHLPRFLMFSTALLEENVNNFAGL